MSIYVYYRNVTNNIHSTDPKIHLNQGQKDRKDGRPTCLFHGNKFGYKIHVHSFQSKGRVVLILEQSLDSPDFGLVLMEGDATIEPKTKETCGSRA